MSIVACVVLAGLVALYVTAPPKRPVGVRVDGSTQDEDRVAQVLEDLELDFETGKISESDRDALRGDLAIGIVSAPLEGEAPAEPRSPADNRPR